MKAGVEKAYLAGITAIICLTFLSAYLAVSPITPANLRIVFLIPFLLGLIASAHLCSLLIKDKRKALESMKKEK